MKKLVKFVMGAAAVAGTACGLVYLLKKVFGLDLFNKDADDDDFDNGFDNGFDDGFSDIDDDENEEADDREYVTLDMEGEKDKTEEKEPAAAETDSAETAAE